MYVVGRVGGSLSVHREAARRMGADKANGVVNYCTAAAQRPLLQKIRYAIWNPEERTFLGRTGHRWVMVDVNNP
ncbi:hypothetical protein RR46_00503 [Papilio xuthus]|uniref:Uncharacterized protein n=1 Tax=Papilio xuthus TaxID=66420 RepID=A0A0N0PA16_PAPXU|nr:hypothetical protein RR46_00503 [Papilio xuthus]